MLIGLTSVDELKHHIMEIELAVIIILFLMFIIKDKKCKCEKCEKNTIIIKNNNK